MASTRALIMAAGSGERFGGGDGKQYVPLHGRPMLAWAMACFEGYERVDGVTVVVAPGHEDRVRQLASDHAIGKFAGTVTGGSTRQESVWQGVEAIAGSCDFVLVHDAARPCVSGRLLDEMMAALASSPAVVPALPAVDTLIHERGGKVDAILDRVNIAGVQTPQGFETQLLLRAHRHAESHGFHSSDDGSLVLAMGEAVKTIPGERTNIKVTYEDDVTIAEAILASQGRAPAF